ncbi:MAG: phage tail protein [Ardenticatenaceae bacterium]|nr:phage tail protein [Ardenticatenaceae bacterium]
MADAVQRETIRDPFSAFNFRVELYEQGSTRQLCSAGFAECDGLEMTMEPKTIREGGNNRRQHHFVGPVSYGQLTLKRGMTANFDLWDWFGRLTTDQGSSLRASGFVVMLTGDRKEQVRFELEGCLPIKLRAPTLNAKDGLIAVEEMQLAYEALALIRPS